MLSIHIFIRLSAYISNITKRIKNTNVNEMFYRAAVANIVNELKKFHLRVIRRILPSKISRYKVNGLCGKEKDDYYKIPEKERLTEKDIRSGTVTVSNIGSLYKNQKGLFVPFLKRLDEIFANPNIIYKW